MSLERSLLIAASFLGILQLTLSNSECPLDTMTPQDNFTKVLDRKKRHLVLPKSTSFVLTLTGLKAIQVKEPTNWNLDLEFDMIWPIPQDEKNKNKERKKNNKKMIKKNYYKLRRHKRDFYDTFEAALSRLGLPGKNCVLRTICEAKTFLHPPGISFIDDLLRVILSHEENMKHLDSYDFAYKTRGNCGNIYKCPVSLLHLLLNSH
ncbi:uncharacterized protein [Chelonus insularis]|uniref:uncharacterized protein n=1 Tax=Chelonus insularis TaxID=460826 RepID=UPI001589A418|nr:uncharacterized protein LOC118064565 [Chelonus insularis]